MKHSGFAENVPRLIVKLPVAMALMRGATSPVSDVVLQVTESRVPVAVAPVGCTQILLLVVMAVEVTWQVPVEAFVAHENAPPGAAVHAATDGFADEPAAAQFVVVA